MNTSCTRLALRLLPFSQSCCCHCVHSYKCVCHRDGIIIITHTIVQLIIAKSEMNKQKRCLCQFLAIYFIKLKITRIATKEQKWIRGRGTKKRLVAFALFSLFFCWFIVFNILYFGSDWVNGNQFEMFLYLWCRLPFCHTAYHFCLSIHLSIYLSVCIAIGAGYIFSVSSRAKP